MLVMVSSENVRTRVAIYSLRQQMHWYYSREMPQERTTRFIRLGRFGKSATKFEYHQGPIVRIRFNPFTLDLDTRQLTRENREIHLAPKAFELLAALVLDRPKVLSKVALQERLWPDTFVAEANLSNLVAEIREALGDRGREQKWIRTAHGFGYAFCGEAITLTGVSETAAGRTICWLEWGRRRFPLSIGEHVIGRDPDVEVRLDSSTVSRRHAKLVVTAEGTVLEDFGSKNGTLRGSERVTSPVPLVDGDAIHIGSLLLTFHVRAQGSTETLA
jgi:DNA-binding winged helix-turn-helix (wHTH) protein